MNQEILTYDWVKITLREVYVRVYGLSYFNFSKKNIHYVSQLQV